MKCVAQKSFLLISLLLLASCRCSEAQPLKEQQTREQRQLKGATNDADVKMMAGNTANMTPAMQMPMTGLAMSPMGNMQLARYPSYPGMMFGAGPTPAAPFLGMPGQLGLQTSIANHYPADPSMGLGYMNLGLMGGANFGQGLGQGGYPGNPQAIGSMYGNSLYPEPQLGHGFGAQPTLDNFAALNNIINLANAQGLGGAPNGGLYGQPGGPAAQLMPQRGYFGGGFDNSMTMHNYAPAF